MNWNHIFLISVSTFVMSKQLQQWYHLSLSSREESRPDLDILAYSWCTQPYTNSKPCLLEGKCMSLYCPLHAVPPTDCSLLLRAAQHYKLRVEAWILANLICAGRYLRPFFSKTCSPLRICPYGSYFCTNNFQAMCNVWHNWAAVLEVAFDLMKQMIHLLFVKSLSLGQR